MLCYLHDYLSICLSYLKRNENLKGKLLSLIMYLFIVQFDASSSVTTGATNNLSTGLVQYTGQTSGPVQYVGQGDSAGNKEYVICQHPSGKLLRFPTADFEIMRQVGSNQVIFGLRLPPDIQKTSQSTGTLQTSAPDGIAGKPNYLVQNVPGIFHQNTSSDGQTFQGDSLAMQQYQPRMQLDGAMASTSTGPAQDKSKPRAVIAPWSSDKNVQSTDTSMQQTGFYQIIIKIYKICMFVFIKP